MVAAKALIRLGQCYEKMGNTEARKAYERVMRDFADRNEAASEARARLAALKKSARTSEDGSGVIFRQIRFDGANENPFAQLSPDGRRMLFADLRNWKANQYSLRIVDLTSGKQQPLIEDYGDKGPWNSFRWGPDGSKVVYTDKQRRQLRIVSSTGGESRLVWASSDPEAIVRPLDWSRDGKHILASVANETEWTTKLAILSAAGGEPRFLISGNYFELDDEYGQFSPDGRFIVSQRWEGSKSSHICVWSVDTGKETRLSEDSAAFSPALWSPDGK